MSRMLTVEVGKSYLNKDDAIVTIVGIVRLETICNSCLFTDMRNKHYDIRGHEVRSSDTSDASPLDWLKAEFIPELVYADQPSAGGILMEAPKKTGAESFEEWRWWGDNMFGPTTPAALVARARNELDKELIEAIKVCGGEWTSSVVEEAADVVLILTRIPGLWEAMERKMVVNHSREWKRAGDGTGSHI